MLDCFCKRQPSMARLYESQSSMARLYKRHQPKTKLPFIIAKWPGNEQKKV